MKGIVGGKEGLIYLFKFLDVDIELTTKFGFGLREGRHLPRQLARLGSFDFLSFALLLKTCHLILYLELFGPE